jgi:hypothetical protein
MVMRAPVKQPAPASGGTKPAETTSAMKQSVTSQKHNEMVEKTGKFESLQPAAPEKTAQPSVTSSGVAPSSAQKQVAVVQVLTGPNAGKELELVKNLTTLGKPGLQVAVLTRRPHGFFITHVEGENFPLVNGRALTNQAHQLNEHDVIELAGVKMEFYFKG